jgi:hypothetical protein
MINNKTLINEIELLKDKLLDLWDKKKHTTIEYINLLNTLKNKERELRGRPLKDYNLNIIGGNKEIKKSLIKRTPVYISNNSNNKYNYFSLQNTNYKFKINNYEFNSLINFLTFYMFINLPNKTTELKYFLKDLTCINNCSNNNLEILNDLYNNKELSDEKNSLKILESLSEKVHYELYTTNKYKANYNKLLEIGIRERIMQNSDLIDKLIKTNNLVLLDSYDIQNKLGNHLIKLRTELKKNKLKDNTETKNIKLYK